MERKVCAITGHRPQKLPWRREGKTIVVLLAEE